MHEFVLPHCNNVEVVDNTERCVLLQEELARTKRIKQQTHAWYKKAAATIRDVTEICEALHEVLNLSGETRAAQLPSYSDSDDDLDDDCAQAEQAQREPTHLPTDTTTMRKQIEKIHKLKDATKVKLREISELAVHHRRGIVHYTEDDSHSFLQQMAIEAHSHSHAAIMVALHCGPAFNNELVSEVQGSAASESEDENGSAAAGESTLVVLWIERVECV